MYGNSYWGIISCNTGISANRIANRIIVQTRKNSDTGYKAIDPQTNEYVVPGKNNYADGLNVGYTWIPYKNMTYIGSQLTWTDLNHHIYGATIEENVIVRSVYSYIVPKRLNYVWTSEGSGI